MITDTNGIKIPCAETRVVPRAQVRANNYNPNSVPKDKMELLKQSILDNGFCFPIVTIWSEEDAAYVIIDGFHRYTISGPEWLNMEYVPVVVLEHTLQQRMAATIQFNKAKGHHQVDLDAELVRSLIEQGMAEDDVSKHLGIDIDTIHRYKQLTGILSLFEKVNYSQSWEMVQEG